MDTGLGLMGFAALNPSYVLSSDGAGCGALHPYCPLRSWVPSLSPVGWVEERNPSITALG